MTTTRYLLLAIAFATGGACRAADPAAGQEFFEKKVRPILVDHCYPCHNGDKTRGDLAVDSQAGLLKGGERGPAVVPYKPESSWLIKAVTYTDTKVKMPPKNRLSDEQIADLTQWVKIGAPDPRTGPAEPARGPLTGLTAEARAWWAFQPVQAAGEPTVKDRSWVRSPVDAFVRARLEAANLKPNPPADKITLLRRATFDLIGMVPTPEEARDFLADDSADAFARVVDRLLASPHYGERWGRHWLDTARYSDTSAQIGCGTDRFPFPDAWTYRDYVIDALNKDKPYDQFIIEQLAADKLDLPSDSPALAALGFITIGERFKPHETIDERINATYVCFMALSVACARCHDHKFDPISQADYYSQYAIWDSITEPNLRGGKQGPEIPTAFGGRGHAMVVSDAPRPKDGYVFLRGDPGQRGPAIERRFIGLFANADPEFKDGSGRLELARGIASKDNPLTARVAVNRIWLHHFGAGLVTTPDNLGTTSEKPSHPELLDWLASYFVDHNWSFKQMHRLIMLSSVYQQSSAANPGHAEVDGENRLLWRANRQPLEFEAIRDSLLVFGNRLDRTLGGRPMNLTDQPYSSRRSIYGYVDRGDLPDVLQQFDFPDSRLPTSARGGSIVPQQALFMMNSPLVIDTAFQMVARQDFAAQTDDRGRITALYQVLFQRDPADKELAACEQFVNEAKKSKPTLPASTAPKKPAPKPAAAAPNGKPRLGPPVNEGSWVEPRPLDPWEQLAHSLLLTSEVVFVK